MELSQDSNAAQQKTRKNVNYTNVFLFIAVSVSLLLSSFSSLLSIMNLRNSNGASDNRPFFDGNTLTLQENSIEAVVEKVSPSVVSILGRSRVGSGLSSYYGQSAGTGIIVSKDGHILTNKHVINGTSKLSVVTQSGETYDDVEVIATDPLNDIAFIKVNGAKDFVPAEIGDSKTVSIGQPVIAIGNALGQYQNTVTYGIISATGRDIQAASESGSGVENLSDMIQTDAAINQGNSGGPLINVAGQVIGINTAISAEGQSVGFAIPIGAAKGMLSSVLKTGDAKRAFLGVTYYTITPDIANKYNLKETVDGKEAYRRSGAYVYSESGSAVRKDSPAEQAGLKSKDIILKVNGVDVGPKGSVSSLVAEYSVGETITLTVVRDSKTIELQVKLGAYGS